MESSLTLKFRGAEAELLDRLVRSGLFATKSEAIRAALVKYGADLGLLRARDIWAAIESRPRRRVTLAQLQKEARKSEDAE
jgi:Arc/MetJ-type ribon-helix-helix transcriptional regulator